MKRRVMASAIVLLLLMGSAQAVSAGSPPTNDHRSGAKPLIIGAPIEFNGTNATTSASDPDDCEGSHGNFAGPFPASIWFSFTARVADRWVFLSAPTVQGHADDFFGITFIYERTGHGLELVDCTAFGNDAKWQPRANAKYLIMIAGMTSDVTGYPPLSDRGGHGTLYLFHSTTAEERYHYVDKFAYDDCGPSVVGEVDATGIFELRLQGNGKPPLVSDQYEYHTIHRNPDNGKWFREDGYGWYRDDRTRRVEGTIFEFTAKESGRPYTLTDMNGDRLYVDHGLLVTRFQIETHGDDVLWNDEFIEGTFELVRERGDHPFFFFDGDFCDIVNDLLGDGGGSTSAAPMSRADLAPLPRTMAALPR